MVVAGVGHTRSFDVAQIFKKWLLAQQAFGRRLIVPAGQKPRVSASKVP